MKITTTTLDKAKELSATHPEVKALVEFYEYITSNDAYETYVVRKMYINSWNKELEKKKVELINTNDEMGTHDKAVDRAMKFHDTIVKFLNDTKLIYNMLTPQEKELVKKDRRLIEPVAI